MSATSILRVLGTLDLDAGAVVAGASQLERPLLDVRLHDRSHLAVGAATGVALVTALPPDVTFELRLPELRAAGAAAVFLICPADEVISSTRWLADRLDLPVVACPGWDPVELAFRLKIAVAASDLDRGMQAVAISARIRSRVCDPDAAVDILREVAGIEVAVIGADSIPLAGTPPVNATVPRRQMTAQIDYAEASTLLAVPVSSSAATDLDPDFWMMAELPPVPRARAESVLAAMQLVAIGVTAWAATSQLEAQRDATLKSSVLAQLLTSSGTIPPHLLEQTLALGWSMTGWHTPVCIRATQSYSEASLEGMTARVRSALRQDFPRFEVVRSGPGWIAWQTQRAEPTIAEVDALIEAMQRIVESIGNRVVAGVGAPRRGAAGFVEGLSEAQSLANAAGRVAGRRVVEHATASATRRLILDATTGSSVASRSNQLLAPLRGSDDHLLETLETYLALESSKSETARALNMHRNTVIKRLERIEALLHVDLGDPEVRLALELACRGRSDAPTA